MYWFPLWAPPAVGGERFKNTPQMGVCSGSGLGGRRQTTRHGAKMAEDHDYGADDEDEGYDIIQATPISDPPKWPPRSLPLLWVQNVPPLRRCLL